MDHLRGTMLSNCLDNPQRPQVEAPTTGCTIWIGRVHFLLRFFSPSQIHLRLKTEKPSQVLLKCEKVCILKSPKLDNLLKTFLTHTWWTFSIRIPSQLLLKWSICSCSTSVETFSDSSQQKYLLKSNLNFKTALS